MIPPRLASEVSRFDARRSAAAPTAPVVWMPGPCAGLSPPATAVRRLFPPASHRRAPALLLLADGGRTPDHSMFIRLVFRIKPARRYVAIDVETPDSPGAPTSRRRWSHGLADHWIGRCPSYSDKGTASDRSCSTFATGAAMDIGTDRRDDRQAIHDSLPDGTSCSRVKMRRPGAWKRTKALYPRHCAKCSMPGFTAEEGKGVSGDLPHQFLSVLSTLSLCRILTTDIPPLPEQRYIPQSTKADANQGGRHGAIHQQRRVRGPE